MVDNEARIHTRNYNFLLSEMSEMRPIWQDIGRFIRPARLARRGLGGSGRKDQRFDSTASNSSRIITHAIIAGWIPKSMVWVLYRIPDSDPARELNRNPRMAAWLQRFSSVVWLTMNRSNFHQIAGETVWDAVTFHTASGYDEEILDARGFQNISYKGLPIGGYVFSEDRHGRVNRMYEPYLLDASQAEAEFSQKLNQPREALPKEIQEALKNNKPHESFEFLRYVDERKDRNPDSPFAKDMEFRALDIFLGKKERVDRTAPHNQQGVNSQIVREGGHNEFPYWVWRWSTQAGERWGCGQSDIAMPIIKLLNGTRKNLAKGLDQATNPGYWVNPEHLLGKPKFQSGLIDYVKDVNQVARPQTYEGRFDFGQLNVNDMRQEIKDIYMSDFMMLPGKTMTAEEVITLRNQLNRVLGSHIESGEDQFLATRVERAASIVLRAGLAPEPPPEMRFVQKIEPQFLGTLARAQQLNDVEAIERFLGATKVMMDDFPEAGDNVDIDKAHRIIGQRLGIPDEILRAVDAVGAIREARRESMEAAQANEEAVQVTKAIAQGANAEKALSQAGQVA